MYIIYRHVEKSYIGSSSALYSPPERDVRRKRSTRLSCGPDISGAEGIAVVSGALMEDRPGDPKHSTKECQEARTCGSRGPFGVTAPQSLSNGTSASRLEGNWDYKYINWGYKELKNITRPYTCLKCPEPRMPPLPSSFGDRRHIQPSPCSVDRRLKPLSRSFQGKPVAFWVYGVGFRIFVPRGVPVKSFVIFVRYLILSSLT